LFKFIFQKDSSQACDDLVRSGQTGVGQRSCSAVQRNLRAVVAHSSQVVTVPAVPQIGDLSALIGKQMNTSFYSCIAVQQVMSQAQEEGDIMQPGRRGGRCRPCPTYTPPMVSPFSKYTDELTVSARTDLLSRPGPPFPAPGEMSVLARRQPDTT
jgi:hypothetical protein